MLREQGAFAELDRLAVNRIGVFYLHAVSRQKYARFLAFSLKFGPEEAAAIPCVVQFEVTKAAYPRRRHAIIVIELTRNGASPKHSICTRFSTAIARIT
jgi:hypothetical protein